MALSRRRFVEALGVASASVLGGPARASQIGGAAVASAAASGPLGLIKLAVALIAVFQFRYILITGGPNALVRDFGASLALFTGELVAYLVCADDQPPFPFRAWPRPSQPGP